ncbi:phage protein [Streptococcus pseudoporcinus]|uniref:Phage protein n=1 Tax=Streptococcus pseudoporcinus TaxID=361101 RepID=A0A4U9XKW6_9STRE|nr:MULTISPECIES: ImmA/IrrE family metallo-endopeptidase [Streptococcus]MCK1248878.1 ImmA/IrrE family metallo-endopeptidase [Streptococcus uberis]VTS13984.1 phage protein [Streptococcus pseudoporcinus]
MNEIQVAGMIYIVKVQEHFKAYDDDRNLWGYCDYEQQIIYIRESLSKQKKRQVLIHELTHAILNEAGYKEQDEELVNRFSIVLHQVLMENPQILTFPF